jgi:hypothetical protein
MKDRNTAERATTGATFHPSPPSLRKFEVYEPKTAEGRESRLGPQVTFHFRRALRKKSREWGRPPGVIALWALRQGLDWIDDQYQTAIILDLVGKLDDADSDEILHLEEVGYKVLPRGGHIERMTVRNVWPDDVQRCARFAEGFALRNANKTQPGTYIIAALAMIAGLVDHVGDGNIKRALDAERRDFVRWLNERLRYAAELVKGQRR